MCVQWWGGSSPPELWEQGGGYIREPRGRGVLWPRQQLTLTRACAHLPRINIPACHSLAWNGLPHPAAITIPSHLLPEA